MKIQPPYPDWFTELRPHQVDAIDQIQKLFEAGNKVVFLDAPTGSGKTLIGEELRRRMNVWGAVYTCSTKSLQEQFLHDYDYAHVLKGRANYPTLDKPHLFAPGEYHSLSAEDCTLTTYDANDCDYCSDCFMCPYRKAKQEAAESPVAVLNSAYLIREMESPKSLFKDRKIVIIDECDVLEQTLLGYIEVRITEKRQAAYGIVPPFHRTKAKSWIDWCEQTLATLKTVRPDGGNGSDEMQKRRRQKEKKYLQGLKSNIERLMKDLIEDENSWVLTEYEADRHTKHGEQKGPIVFKPVWVKDHAGSLLWDKADHFLLMSASIISPDAMAESLGLAENYTWNAVYVDSTFPVENRPILVAPIADMSKAKGIDEWKKMGGAIQVLLDKHPDDRVLIHSVSYQLTKFLVDGLKMHMTNYRDIFTYTNANQRERALSEYKQSSNSILIAPSMDRGIDLPGDLCRVQIIAKVPYPFLGDKQISAKLYSPGGNLWYGMETIRTMVQMTGRGVRSKDDYAVSYILDKQFVNRVWKDNSKMMPEWWKDGLVWDTGRLIRELKE